MRRRMLASAPDGSSAHQRLEERMRQEGPAVNEGSPSSRGELTRDQIVEIFSRRQEAYDNLAAAAIASFYAPNCIVESPMGGTHEGRDAAQTVIRAWFDAFVDMKLRVQTLLID